MIMRWRVGSSHQLPDAFAHMLRSDPAADPIDDSLPDHATSGKLGDYGGPQGPVLDGFPLKELEPAKEGVIDAGGVREKGRDCDGRCYTMRAESTLAKPSPAEFTPAHCTLAAWNNC